MPSPGPAAVVGEEQTNSWQAIRREVLRRISTREWAPGELIPHEAELAAEFGCARSTVNRALRAIAESGLIERRRKAGTRVALHPVRKAMVDIPVLRVEIEGRGEKYSFALLQREDAVPPRHIQARLQTAPERPILHLVGLHMADGHPHALEDRWIDPEAVPSAVAADFARISPNEWLVRHIPYEGGDISFSADVADGTTADALGCAKGAAVFVTERTTWAEGRILTTVRLLFGPGYRLQTRI